MNASPILLLVALFSLPTCLALAQDSASPPPSQEEVEKRMCAETACQRDLRVTLKKKDGSTYDQTFKAFPAVVQDFGITVVAGQTVHVEAELVDGKLANMHVVDAVRHPEKTLTASFTQNKDGGMLLAVSNPFGETIRFRMGIMPLDADELYATSSCPIGAGQKNFEMWPYPIFQVVLGDGRVLAKGESGACVE